MKLRILFFLLIFPAILYAQTDTLKTYYGCTMSPYDTLFVLNLFVNIHYNSFDDDPVQDSTPNWLPGPVNTVNQSPPKLMYGHCYCSQAKINLKLARGLCSS